MLTSVFKAKLDEVQIEVTKYWEDNGTELRLELCCEEQVTD
jgi:hypothetical protein